MSSAGRSDADETETTLDGTNDENSSASYSSSGSDDSSDDEGSPASRDAQEPNAEQGFLVYLFAGDQDPCEIVVFRKICMKYGLQAWDEMEAYLPWRTRAAFRTTLCHIIHKQALSEYSGIRADPFEIQKDNPLDFSLGEDSYTVKSGMLVNQRWDRSPGECDEMRSDNIKKYGLTEEEASMIEIPVLFSIEYMRQLSDNRRQSLLVRRAAIRSELARRRGETDVDLGIEDLVLMPSDALELPTNTEELQVTFGPNRYSCEISDSVSEDEEEDEEDERGA
jgi:hypothetical protein